MVISKKSWFTMICLACLMLVLGACSSNNSSEESSSEKKVTDAVGEMTFPANPKKILAPNMEDYLVTLGLTPAAQWSIGTSVHTYLQDKLADVPLISWDMPIEDVIEAEPDLIMFESEAAIQEGMYEEYTKVAPTYVFKSEDTEDWRTQLTVMGELFGKKDTAEKAIEDYEQKAEDAKAQVKEAIGDESAAIIWVTGGQFFVFEGDRYASNVLYKDLGIKMPTYISDLGESQDVWQAISLEALADLDADHLFIAAAANEEGIETLEKSSVYKSIPAVEKDQVYFFEDSSNWTTNAKIANDVTIDLVLESIKK
ncbi:ABC transporter substrate-binding protein [Pradoshia sp.]|uniref:ABC transporter substrate-binding protein n=1 Tax=Pradoshia sp. TaxID=2651281 RepID=UPI003F09DF7A